MLASLVLLAPFGAAPAHAEAGDVVLYRIFLRDGSTLVSYGEYTRVGDRLVFSLPLSTASNPPLHLTSLPASAVDWASTERYADSARYQHYRSTRGEEDFAALTASVAQALDRIARIPEASERLALARAIQRDVAEWPRQHYGYRVEDVREIGILIDEVVADLQAATGAQAFDLNLVAMTSPPPELPVLPPPTLQELIAQALAAARATDVPAERVSLLQSVVGALDEDGSGAAAGLWAASARRAAARELSVELKIDQEYRALAHSAVARATAYAARADVRAIESVLRLVSTRDRELGHRRPNEVQAALTAVQAKLAEARQLRLEQDHWQLRQNAYRRYERAVARPLQTFAEARRWLEDVRALAGPDVGDLATLERRADEGLRTLGRTEPPDDLSSLHGLLTQAWQLAREATRLRQRAVATGDLDVAWSASSAASGAMMLFDRARSELTTSLTPPDQR